MLDWNERYFASNLRSWLLKRYGHFEFLKILEVQKKGRPHLHVLISGIPYITQQDLADVWRKYGGGHIWIKAINKNINFPNNSKWIQN